MNRSKDHVQEVTHKENNGDFAPLNSQTTFHLIALVFWPTGVQFQFSKSHRVSNFVEHLAANIP